MAARRRGNHDKIFLQEIIFCFQASFDVADLKGIDPEIFKTVSHLQGIVHKKIKVDNDRCELYSLIFL